MSDLRIKLKDEQIEFLQKQIEILRGENREQLLAHERLYSSIISKLREENNAMKADAELGTLVRRMPKSSSLTHELDGRWEYLHDAVLRYFTCFDYAPEDALRVGLESK